MTVIAGAVLAAGAGRRMGGPKAGLLVGGRRLVDRAVEALTAGGCAPVLAVVRADVDVPGAAVVVNPDPDRGMRSSLELAVEFAAAEPQVDALLVLLVDTPGVGAEAVAAVRNAWRPGRITVARYGARRSHPIVMALPNWRESLGSAGPDEGARAYLAGREALVDEIAVPGDPRDLDGPGDVPGRLG